MLCVLKIIPIIKNKRQRRIVDITPTNVPQSRASWELFFFVAINPPKKDEVYIAKNERGRRNLCGFFILTVMQEKREIRAKKIISTENIPMAMETSMPF